MILINNKLFTTNQLTSSTLTAEEIEMIERMSRYQEIYSFFSIDHFHFVLHLRQSIIQASRLLYSSKARFSTFKNARCNQTYWNLTQQGGFKLKTGVIPSEAIQDIFENGSKYSFECATAIVILFYKAVLDSINLDQFNRIYQGIYLRDWQSDEDLPIFSKQGNDYLPGDCLYFNNPEFDPNQSQWRGENAIDLGNGLYYGHGIGIKTAEAIIEALNKRRKPNSTESAYLLSQVTRIDNRYLYQFANQSHGRSGTPNFIIDNRVVAKIGHHSFCDEQKSIYV